MAIWINQETRAICQGLTGKKASAHVADCLSYCGTRIVGGVVPGKGGIYHLDLPVFDTVLEAVEQTHANATLILTPPAQSLDALLEAIESKLELIICITEGIPIWDMMYAKRALARQPRLRLVGPNSPGIITPGSCKLGIMPSAIHRPGCIGIVSRSGTLLYEAVKQTSELRLGQSTCIGIGGDPITGVGFCEALLAFETDPATQAIVLLGELGGSSENEAALLLRSGAISKPVVSYIAGWSAPTGHTMGHAGAIGSGRQSSAEEKMAQLQAAGAKPVRTITQLSSVLSRALRL